VSRPEARTTICNLGAGKQPTNSNNIQKPPCVKQSTWPCIYADGSLTTRKIERGMAQAQRRSQREEDRERGGKFRVVRVQGWERSATPLKSHLQALATRTTHQKETCSVDTLPLFQRLSRFPRRQRLSCSPTAGSLYYWAFPEGELVSWDLGHKNASRSVGF